MIRYACIPQVTGNTLNPFEAAPSFRGQSIILSCRVNTFCSRKKSHPPDLWKKRVTYPEEAIEGTRPRPVDRSQLTHNDQRKDTSARLENCHLQTVAAPTSCSHDMPYTAEINMAVTLCRYTARIDAMIPCHSKRKII